MTLEETRQLGIEFERRLQTILPSTKIVDKIETDDIYAFLNQYQNLFVKDLYTAQSLAKDNTEVSKRIDDYLKTLYVDAGFDLDEDGYFSVPDLYFYISSYSGFAKSTNEGEQDVYLYAPNEYVSIYQMNAMRNTLYNQGRIIRKPLITIVSAYKDNTTFELMQDEHSNFLFVHVKYLKFPKPFTILGDGTACELPIECFDELVDGAIKLYISYKAGGSTQSQNASKLPLNQSNTLNNQLTNEQEDEQ